MERPDAVACGAQYAAANDAKAKAEDDVELVTVNLSQLVLGDAVGEAFTERMNRDAGNVAQHRCEIDVGLGIGSCLVPVVVPLLVAKVQRQLPVILDALFERRLL